jgi:recombination protein RecA
MSDPKAVIKRLQAEDSELTVQMGREGDIIGKPTGYVSTRCPTLDYLIGRPGVPMGGISTIVGAFGSGKSTVCLNILAETQAQGGQAVIFDTEGRLDFDRAEKLGINLDELIIAQPDTLEQMFSGVKDMIRAAREVAGETNSVTIVVDSVAGAPLEKEVKAEKLSLGAQSLLIRRELRVMSMLVNRQRVALVFTSQPRMKISLGKWGKPETSWLGKDPLGHASMTTLLLEEQKKFGEDRNSPIGHVIMATLVDTRIAGCTIPDCQECRRKGFRRTFDFYGATGPDFFGSALNVLQEEKVVTYNKGWYTFRDSKPFRLSEMEEKCAESPEMLDALAEILKGGHHVELTNETGLPESTDSAE